mmetsp:Transcript_151518/g.279367  ORF Transcript_151518/g.279367 Transcript_151518/m.279367 type:complete len:707 (-) Transcript_151518:102-2222(-)
MLLVHARRWCAVMPTEIIGSRFVAEMAGKPRRFHVTPKDRSTVSFESLLTDAQIRERLAAMPGHFGRKLAEKDTWTENQRAWGHFLVYEDDAKSGGHAEGSGSRPSSTKAAARTSEDASDAAPSASRSAKPRSTPAAGGGPVPRSFKVMQKGEEVEFQSALTDDEVRERLGSLQSRFGNELAEDSHWTDKKRAWGHYLVHEAESMKGTRRGAAFASKTQAAVAGRSSASSAASQTFQVTKQGKRIEFQSALTEEEVRAQLQTRSDEFAKGLSEKPWKSESQRAWAHFLAQEKERSPRSYTKQDRGQPKQQFKKRPGSWSSAQAARSAAPAPEGFAGQLVSLTGMSAQAASAVAGFHQDLGGLVSHLNQQASPMQSLVERELADLPQDPSRAAAEALLLVSKLFGDTAAGGRDRLWAFAREHRASAEKATEFAGKYSSLQDLTSAVEVSEDPIHLLCGHGLPPSGALRALRSLAPAKAKSLEGSLGPVWGLALEYRAPPMKAKLLSARYRTLEQLAQMLEASEDPTSLLQNYEFPAPAQVLKRVVPEKAEAVARRRAAEHLVLVALQGRKKDSHFKDLVAYVVSVSGGSVHGLSGKAGSVGLAEEEVLALKALCEKALSRGTEDPNKDLVDLLLECAELSTDSRRQVAYRNAASEVKEYPVRIASPEVAQQIPGVGASISATLGEWLQTGASQKLEDLRAAAGVKQE